MPVIIKKFPKIKLLLTGGGYKEKFPWLINKGIVTKKELYNLIYNSKFMCVPLRFGSGTRIKIIEALSLGTIVISTSKGIEGIKIYKKNPPFVANNKIKMIKLIYKTLKNFNKIKKKSIERKNFYNKNYSMKNITDRFIKSNLIEYFDEFKN